MLLIRKSFTWSDLLIHIIYRQTHSKTGRTASAMHKVFPSASQYSSNQHIKIAFSYFVASPLSISALSIIYIYMYYGMHLENNNILLSNLWYIQNQNRYARCYCHDKSVIGISLSVALIATCDVTHRTRAIKFNNFIRTTTNDSAIHEFRMCVEATKLQLLSIKQTITFFGRHIIYIHLRVRNVSIQLTFSDVRSTHVLCELSC